MAIESAKTVTATALFRTWQRSAGDLSGLERERLTAFDRSLARAQLYMQRHSPGWAEKEVVDGLTHLRTLRTRMPGLSASLAIPETGASRLAIDAALESASTVRAAVGMLARL